MKSEVAMMFNVRTLEDGSGEVRAPDGRVIARTPDMGATGWLLGVIRLAAHAHKELKDKPLELYKVLEIDPVVGEAQALVDQHALILGPQGEPLL